jgi:hypothetical protein
MFDVAKILGPECSQVLDNPEQKSAVEPMVTIQIGKTLAAGKP